MGWYSALGRASGSIASGPATSTGEAFQPGWCRLISIVWALRIAFGPLGFLSASPSSSARRNGAVRHARGQEHASGSRRKACRTAFSAAKETARARVTNLSAAGTEVLVEVFTLRLSPPLLQRMLHLHEDSAVVADDRRPVTFDCALVE